MAKRKKIQKTAKPLFLSINPENPEPRKIGQAVEILRNGGVVCYPTDTMYGIGCDIYNSRAVKRVYQIKKRPKHKPFSFMCSDLKNIARYSHVSNIAYRLMKKNLPGAYTFVLPGTKLVPKIMLTRQKTVGIRVPDNPICLALVKALGNPILNTSATTDTGDHAPLSEAYEVEELYGRQLDLIIDGETVYPDPSTVISLIGDYPEILREGKGDTTPFL